LVKSHRPFLFFSFRISFPCAAFVCSRRRDSSFFTNRPGTGSSPFFFFPRAIFFPFSCVLTQRYKRWLFFPLSRDYDKAIAASFSPLAIGNFFFSPATYLFPPRMFCDLRNSPCNHRARWWDAIFSAPDRYESYVTLLFLVFVFSSPQSAKSQQGPILLFFPIRDTSKSERPFL